MNLLLAMVMSGICALGLVHMFELVYREAPPRLRQQWSKRSAMRCLWGMSGILIILGQFPLGMFLAIAALPVCLAHLQLVEQSRNDAPIAVVDVARLLLANARKTFRTLVERSRERPR